MTWRELWKQTVTNLRTLLGFSPPPPARSSRLTTSPPTPVGKRKPPALPGPVNEAGRADRPNYPVIHTPHTPSQTPAQTLPQTIDLVPTRHVPPPSAPLRTRKAVHIPVDLALDAAAFAAAKAQPPAQLPAPPDPPAPEMTWTRQGVAQVEQPSSDTLHAVDPFAAESFADEEPAAWHNGTGGSDYGNGHHNGNGNNGGEDGNEEDNEDSEDNADGDSVALTTLLESLLFVAPEPVDPRQLAQTLDQPLEIIELGLAELADYYQRSLRGLRVQRFNGKVQLVTTPASAPFIETFLNLDNTTRLSSPALETLAVIAYRQPVTRAQIEAVRGVDCAGVLRSLVQRGLVAEMGRMEGAGRPILYGVTELFMQHFGLMEMGELPPLEETEADRLWAVTVMDEQELNKPQQ